MSELVIELQVTTIDPGSDNKLIGREDRLALSSHRGRGGFLAGGGPMECGPRDLVQVWAAEPSKARQEMVRTRESGCQVVTTHNSRLTT